MSVMEKLHAANPALDADRQVALDDWLASLPPSAEPNPAAVLEAAMRAPLTGTGKEARFDHAAFGELVEFITELPF